MGFFRSTKAFFINWNNFRGRALRSEFWFALLFQLLFYIATFLFFFMLFMTEKFDKNFVALMIDISLIASFVVFLVPNLTLGMRRFHDMNQSGIWWVILVLAFFLLGMVSLIGLLFMVFWVSMMGTDGDNHFGPPRNPAELRATPRP